MNECTAIVNECIEGKKDAKGRKAVGEGSEGCLKTEAMRDRDRDEVERSLKKNVCTTRTAEEDELWSSKCNFGIAQACMLSSRSLFGL